MEYIRCESCIGKKKIIGLGNMEKNCTNCNGIGKVKADIEKEIDKLEDELLKGEIIKEEIRSESDFSKLPEIIKKRGRPARIK